MEDIMKVVLFGASNYGAYIYEKLPNHIGVLAFVDNNRTKWGSSFYGIQVISPTSLLDIIDEIDYIFITSSYYEEITKQLNKLGFVDKSYYILFISKEIVQFDMCPQGSVYVDIRENSDTSKDERDKEIIKTANLALDNKIFFHSRWEEYSYGNIDDVWFVAHFNNNSWLLNLHRLENVKRLLKSYKFWNNKKYLRKAIEITLSWINSNSLYIGNGLIVCKTKWAWNDHAVADRLLVLVEVLYTIDGEEEYSKEKEEIKTSVLYHGAYLYEDDNYAEYNHGIIMDRALMVLATSFVGSNILVDWEKKARIRLEQRLNNDFSANGVHKEHSSWYHLYVYRMIKAIKLYSDKRGIEIFNACSDRVRAIEDSYYYLVYNDSSLPLIGDSFYYVDREANKSKVKKGLFYCKEAGVLIYKEDGIEFYCLAGFHSTVHKHADDCSFILRVNGRDLLLDGGMYNYQESDSTRRYMRSVFAHNTVIVGKESYDIGESNIGKSKIENVVYKDNVLSINMRHILYDGVDINRHISYIEVYDVILIVDTINSSTEYDYSQNFLINPELEFIRNNKIYQVFNDDISSLRIRQHNKIDEIEYYYGNDKPFRGWQSIVNDQIHPVHNILYNRSGKDVKFITSIEFGDYSVEKIIKDNNLILVIDNKEILIKNYCDMEP